MGTDLYGTQQQHDRPPDSRTLHSEIAIVSRRVTTIVDQLGVLGEQFDRLDIIERMVGQVAKDTAELVATMATLTAAVTQLVEFADRTEALLGAVGSGGIGSALRLLKKS